VGLGLNDEKGISLKGLEAAREADVVLIEVYTSLMPDLSLERLEVLIGKKVMAIKRSDLEEMAKEGLLREASEKKVALLIPGDPLIATTHISLRVAAEKMGVVTRIVHGASIISAAIGLSGLQNYKFGRSVTIPFPSQDRVSETPYDVLKDNKALGLHTLVFLDIKEDEKRYMKIGEALEILRSIEIGKRDNVVTERTLIVGIAKAGSEKQIVKAGCISELIGFDFGGPPQILIFPGKLHFMEEESLEVLGGYKK
jgi:diphthine synthase